MTELCFERNEVSISDWGLERTVKQPLVELGAETPPVEVTPKIISDQFRDQVTGEPLWDEVRDVLHAELGYDEKYETKVKAGNAVGCIRRFLFEAEQFDILLVNTSFGTAVAVFDGPTVYDPDQPHAELDSNHIFRRPVQFIRDEEREPVVFESSHLPGPLKPNQQTMTSVDRSDLAAVLGHTEALSAMADTAALVSK